MRTTPCGVHNKRMTCRCCQHVRRGETNLSTAVQTAATRKHHRVGDHKYRNQKETRKWATSNQGTSSNTEKTSKYQSACRHWIVRRQLVALRQFLDSYRNSYNSDLIDAYLEAAPWIETQINIRTDIGEGRTRPTSSGTYRYRVHGDTEFYNIRYPKNADTCPEWDEARELAFRWNPTQATSARPGCRNQVVCESCTTWTIFGATPRVWTRRTFSGSTSALKTSTMRSFAVPQVVEVGIPRTSIRHQGGKPHCTRRISAGDSRQALCRRRPRLCTTSGLLRW